MLTTNNERLRVVIDEMHEAVLRKERKNSSKMEYKLESQIYEAICTDFNMDPHFCARYLNEKYGYDLMGNDIIQIFKMQGLGHPVGRKNIFERASLIADYFFKAAQGDKEAYQNFEKMRRTYDTSRKVRSYEKILVIAIYNKHKEIDVYNDYEKIIDFSNTISRYFLYDISDGIALVYNYPQYRDKRKKSKYEGKKITLDEAMRHIFMLENIIERSNAMLQDLQDEFDEELAASKVQELIEFFSKLNSEKYGFILDELVRNIKGAKELNKQGYHLPLEVNGILITLRKMIQFVKDSHIEPILKVGAVKEVTAKEIEFCDYDGTPFSSIDEKKLIRVISPGWFYKDKEIQISRPKVKEEL